MTLFCLVSGFWVQGPLIWEWGGPYEVYAPPYLSKGDVPQPTGYFWGSSARVTNFLFLLTCYESILVTPGAHMLKCIERPSPWVFISRVPTLGLCNKARTSQDMGAKPRVWKGPEQRCQKDQGLCQETTKATSYLVNFSWSEAEDSSV